MLQQSSDRLIGIAGRRSSGKDTAGVYYSRSGLLHISVSDEIRREANARRLDTGQRAILIAVGRELRKTRGGDVFIQRAVERWVTQRDRFLGGLAISGHFNLAEAQAVLDQEGRMIWLHTDNHVRLQRERQRGRADAPDTVEELLAQEEGEYKGLDGPLAPQLAAVEHLPGVVRIENNGSRENLYRQLDQLL